VSQPTDAPAAASTPSASLTPDAANAAPPAPAARDRRKYDRSIIEGPLNAAVWKIAAPAIATSMIGGAQGIIDHALVGHLVGKNGNAAIGVSWQIFLVVLVFISSIFIGMSILVARFAGANDEEMVNRTVYQAFLTAIGLSFLVLAPIGYFAAPWLLQLVGAQPGVIAEALPFLRINFLFSGGMMVFFMLGGALRSAGDARTPMWLGFWLTALNIAFNVLFIVGWGPIPAYGTKGAAIGTAIAGWLVAGYSLWRLWGGGWVVHFPHDKHGFGPDWAIIKSLFRFGLPAGVQGIAMNVGGVLMLGYIGRTAYSADAQAVYAVAYGQLFSFITWTSQGLLGAAATVAGQNLGAKQPDRADEAVHVAARFAFFIAAGVGLCFLFFPRLLLAAFGMQDPVTVEIGVQLLRTLSVSGIFIAVALTYTGGLQGTGDTKSPLYISIVSQVAIPLGICFVIHALGTLEPLHIWLAILAGHAARCALSVRKFNQGKWRQIKVAVDGHVA
jgi:putative MATE family efflux protein